MSDLFDFKKPAQLFGVMGNPIGHSRSPEIHHLFAEQVSISIDYQRIHVDIGGFIQAVSNFQAGGGRGLNITVPFKVEAWQLADSCTQRAQQARAVNTLWFEGSAIQGDNTDGVGLCADLIDNLDCPIANRRVLVMGAGGAVRGVLGQLLAQRPHCVVVANRTVDKAVELIQAIKCGTEIDGCGYDDLDGMGFDIVINGTSASLTEDIPALPPMQFAEGALAYDMVYANQPTAFMRWATGVGVSWVADGLGMLVEQAAESFFIWHKVRPQTRPVIKALRR